MVHRADLQVESELKGKTVRLKEKRTTLLGQDPPREAIQTAESLGRPTSDAGSLRVVVRDVLSVCRVGRLLVIGLSVERLVRHFLDEGVDAYGFEFNGSSGQRKVNSCYGRCDAGDMLPFCYETNAFESVVILDVLERLNPASVPAAISEIRRVAKSDLFVRIVSSASPPDPRNVTWRTGEWWEEQFLASGFQRHPLGHRAPSFDGEVATWKVILSFEKRQRVMVESGFVGLSAGGIVSRSMLARYQFASTFIKPGDSVTHLNCGNGEATYVMAMASLGSTFLGLVSNERMRKVANRFQKRSNRLHFEIGEPADAGQNSANTIVLIDQATDTKLLRGIISNSKRILVPGGRLILGLTASPDQRGNWLSSIAAVQMYFEIEGAYGAVGIDFANGEGPPPRERLLKIDLTTEKLRDLGYAILICSKTPLKKVRSDLALPFRNLRPADHAETQSSALRFWKIEQFYEYPWIFSSLLLIGWRVNDKQVFLEYVQDLLNKADPASADAGAALCMLLYYVIENGGGVADEDTLIRRSRRYLKLIPNNPHILRWQISVSFALGKLGITRGNFRVACDHLRYCVGLDSMLSDYLAVSTKFTEAYFLLGWLHYVSGEADDAKKWWTAGIDFGSRMVKQPMSTMLINEEWPNLFDHGDGMREVIYALENVAKCANGLHILQRDHVGERPCWQEINNTFRAQRDDARLSITSFSRMLALIGVDLSLARKDLASVTTELEESRSTLVARTKELEGTRNDLLSRTADLEESRHFLVGCTTEADNARRGLQQGILELDALTERLLERTSFLNRHRKLVTVETDLRRLQEDLKSIETSLEKWGSGAKSG